ncbi:MAG TPA: protein-disulfide reductase DsbD N-terminal domain-containing protein [Gemmatimonadaceae bacterium]|jgi:thiol:disulfide interchange protein DsbD
MHATRAALLVLLAACGGKEAASVSNRPVVWSVRADSAATNPDGTLRSVVLRASINPGWHVYSITQTSGGPVPMKVQLDPAPPFALSPAVNAPQPTKGFDKNFGIETETYDGTPEFRIPVDVADGVDPAGGVVTVRVRYQACTDKVCLPARTETLTLPLKASVQ